MSFLALWERQPGPCTQPRDRTEARPSARLHRPSRGLIDYTVQHLDAIMLSVSFSARFALTVSLPLAALATTLVAIRAPARILSFVFAAVCSAGFVLCFGAWAVRTLFLTDDEESAQHSAGLLTRKINASGRFGRSSDLRGKRLRKQRLHDEATGPNEVLFPSLTGSARRAMVGEAKAVQTSARPFIRQDTRDRLQAVARKAAQRRLHEYAVAQERHRLDDERILALNAPYAVAGRVKPSLPPSLRLTLRDTGSPKAEPSRRVTSEVSLFAHYFCANSGHDDLSSVSGCDSTGDGTCAGAGTGAAAGGGMDTVLGGSSSLSGSPSRSNSKGQYSPKSAKSRLLATRTVRAEQRLSADKNHSSGILPRATTLPSPVGRNGEEGEAGRGSASRSTSALWTPECTEPPAAYEVMREGSVTR